MTRINFNTTLGKIGLWTILRLPKSASVKLPSRGMVMVEGTINAHRIQIALEPDGEGSHWFKVDESTLKAIKARVGSTVTLSIEPSKVWPEPETPGDLKSALLGSPSINPLWVAITPMARWDWIRWINSTKNPETRAKRITNMLSMLKAGKRRPCCFNRTACTDPYLSNAGILSIT